MARLDICIRLLLILSTFYLTSATTVIGNNTCISSDFINDASLVTKFKQISGAKVRWAIIALTRPDREDVDVRNTKLAQKFQPYSKLHNITTIFFSEEEVPSKTLLEWTKAFKDVGAVRVIDTSSKGFSGIERYGYKYMCKFFALDLYEYLKDDYDYYFRCDTDCYLKQLEFDVFQWAVDNSVEYGYAMRKLEAHNPTKKSLPYWTENYVEKCGLLPSALMDGSLQVCFNFYNNFHIGKVSFFRRPDVQHFLLAVNASGYIKSKRWGDSTIQAYAVRLFMHPAAIVQVPNFSYIHGSHGHRMISTFGDGNLTAVPQRLPNWKYTPLPLHG
jgi:Glycolipid 2-alpha-mannosyltransferase